MPTIFASESLTIAAPASDVYRILADYRDGHKRILPPQFFGRLDLLAGGRGAGTKIRFEMKAFGRTNTAPLPFLTPPDATAASSDGGATA